MNKLHVFHEIYVVIYMIPKICKQRIKLLIHNWNIYATYYQQFLTWSIKWTLRKFQKICFLKEIYILKENEASFKIFANIIVVEMKILKSNNYLLKTCYSTMVISSCLLIAC
jgi:hypothetical protein